jgi:transposase
LVEQAAQMCNCSSAFTELESRLAKDSHNSSKPPSSGPLFKKPPPRSLRQPNRKKPGGQIVNPGATRGFVDAPSGQCADGRKLLGIAAEEVPERRQVIDLVVRHDVTEYRIVAGQCACQCHRSAFPEGNVDAPQYAARISAFAVYLTQYQQLPHRTLDNERLLRIQR